MTDKNRLFVTSYLRGAVVNCAMMRGSIIIWYEYLFSGIYLDNKDLGT
jgi:hypothetical protein